MKKILAVLLAMTMVLALGINAFAADNFEFVAALHTTPGGIEELTVQRFGELLSEATDGHVTVSTFAGNSLGTEAENLTQSKTGEVDFVLFGQRRHDRGLRSGQQHGALDGQQHGR